MSPKSRNAPASASSDPTIGESGAKASEAVRKARARSADGHERDPHLVELSTGVVMKVNRVPAMLMADIVSTLSANRPRVPEVLIESKGRVEQNPDDPDYQERLQNHNAVLATAINDAMVLMGSEISKLPKGVPGPDDKRFLSRMQALHRPIDSEDLRYLAWVKYVAAIEPNDITELLGAIGRLSGVSETDVQTAVDNFRR